MLTGGSRTFVWDFDNRLDTVNASGGSGVMAYDYTGIRVKKSGSTGMTYFPFSSYQIEPDGVTVKYIRLGIENIASKKSTGEKLFYHNDHLGGVNITTDGAGFMAQIIEYDPWGKVSREEGIGDSLRRFTGKMLDPESGLYYYGGRYYDPELGRFISPDPFVPQPDDPQSLNRYSYVLNNPVNNIDPSGYFFKKLFKKIGKFFKTLFKNPAKLFASIAVGVFTGFLAGPAGLGFTGFAQGAIAGAAAGATFAGLTGGNPLLGTLTGGLFGGLTGGILGAPVPGADFPGLSTPALVHAAGAGAFTVAQGEHGTGCRNCLPPGVRPPGLPQAAETPFDEPFRVTTRFGGHTRFSDFHPGVDLASRGGSFVSQPVYATDAGRITGLGTSPTGADFISLTTDNGVLVIYSHTQRIPGIDVGSRVVAGQGVGTINLSGRVTGPHLHLETQFGRQRFDPLFYLGR